MKSPVGQWKLLKRKCKIYDVDKKELIAETESMYEAAKYLGISDSLVCATIKNKSINRNNKLGLRIAIR